MAHKEQMEFCQMVKEKFPQYFNNRSVVDVGSLDINGNNRYLFHKCEYTGIDIANGPNVDIVGKAHEILNGRCLKYDVVISTEMAEHCRELESTLYAMYNCLNDGGLFLFTCAAPGRAIHGTSKSRPQDSPSTNDWYKNISIHNFVNILRPEWFDEFYIKYDTTNYDLQVFAIKK